MAVKVYLYLGKNVNPKCGEEVARCLWSVLNNGNGYKKEELSKVKRISVLQYPSPGWRGVLGMLVKKKDGYEIKVFCRCHPKLKERSPQEVAKTFLHEVGHLLFGEKELPARRFASRWMKKCII